jgi:hypothetical protein
MDAGAQCVDLTTDTKHCGSCDGTCVSCERCFLSACQATPFLSMGVPVVFGDGSIGVTADWALIGDFDADGRVDLALVGGVEGQPVTTLEIYFGDSQGGFPRSQSFEIGDGGQIWDVAAGDVDGDGKVDIVLAVSVPGAGDDIAVGVAVFPNLAAGGQGLRGPFVTNPAMYMGDLLQGFYAVRLSVADFNSDGISDVAVSNPATGIDVLYGIRGGGFRGGAAVFPGSDAGWAPYMSVGDLDGDGRTDLAVVDATQRISILLQSADGGLGPIGPQLNPTDYPNVAIADHKLILVRFSGAIDSYRLNADGGFDLVQHLDSVGFMPGTAFESALAADMNADGIPDLLATDLQTLFVWMNHEPEGFGQPTMIASGSGFTGSMAVGDLNGDGRPDVARTGGLGETAIFFNQCSP